VHALRVLESATRAGYATHAIWRHVAQRLLDVVDPIPAWLAELYQAKTTELALQFIAEGLAEHPSSVPGGPDLETGFRALRFHTHTIALEAFLDGAIGSLATRNIEPDTCAELRRVHAVSTRDPQAADPMYRVDSILRAHVVASKRAWLAIIPLDAGDFLERVSDKATFHQFVHALALEREWGEELEQAGSRRGLDGPFGWVNTSLPGFLRAATAGHDPRPDDEPPTWRRFAEFLYTGKIYE
jgi:hypothetical protein